MDRPFGNALELDSRTFDSLDLQGILLEDRTFDNCTFRRCSFLEAVLARCRFRGCLFEDCDLSLARVPDTTFSATHFERCTLMGINWTEAAWPRLPLLRSIDFCRCQLSHGTFIGLRLPGIAIEHCVARDVDFSDADLSRASLAGTDLTGSRFARTNLTRADLVGATHYRIDAACNTIQGARFSLPDAISLLHSLDIVLTGPDGEIGTL